MAALTGAHRALLARCQALLGKRRPEDAFQEAIEHAPAVPPFQRARAELLYGEWLRRARRRTDARGHLRSALETFQALGAVPWAERAEAEPLDSALGHRDALTVQVRPHLHRAIQRFRRAAALFIRLVNPGQDLGDRGIPQLPFPRNGGRCAQ
jgi:hypothetical protein